MTPSELLEEAKRKFIVLYHKDETDLNSLLRQALGKFQEKAGALAQMRIESEVEGSIALPSDFLALAVAVDSMTRYAECDVNLTDRTFTIIDVKGEHYPVTFHYFRNLRDWPLSEDLPPGMTGVLLDYLFALIDYPNTERERAVYAQTGQQVDLPSRQDLKDRIAQLEEQMEEGRSISIPMTVF